MSNDINYVESDIDLGRSQPEETGCTRFVHQEVCVQGTVSITPNITAGVSESFCIGSPIFGGCTGDMAQTCTFAVGQNICVQIPLTFSAVATAAPNGLVCNPPAAGPCPGEPEPPIGCTLTIGAYKNNSSLTNSLITAAGGSIMLGTGGGLSYPVTTANANAVFDFDVPSPPAPQSPPFKNQYQVLYAQLLGAKLNVLRLVDMGAKICEFATTAISAADAFLANSPAGGTSGAPGFQEPLATFNEGKAPGCPPHCQ